MARDENVVQASSRLSTGLHQLYICDINLYLFDPIYHFLCIDIDPIALDEWAVGGVGQAEARALM